MSDHVKAAQTAYYLSTLKEQERVDAEFVTDTILQVLLYLHTDIPGKHGGPWILCQAIDVIAEKFDEGGNDTFASFIVAFNSAWNQWDARSRVKRLRHLRDR